MAEIVVFFQGTGLHLYNLAKMPTPRDGKSGVITLGPVTDLAVRSLSKLGMVNAYRQSGNCASLMLYEMCSLFDLISRN